MDIHNRNSIDPMFQVTIPEKAPKQSNWLGRIVQTISSLNTLVARVGGAFDRTPTQEVSDRKSPDLTEVVKPQLSRKSSESMLSIASAESFDLGDDFPLSLSTPSPVSSPLKTSSGNLSLDSGVSSREEVSLSNKQKVGTDVAVFENGDFDIISIYEEEVSEEDKIDEVMGEFYENLPVAVVESLYEDK